jgi:Phosphotransferase enzyme family
MRGEIRLDGGIANRGLVVRVGNTVRRPRPPSGAATQALLRHLEKVGFDGAPRHLGQDDQGRDVLGYVAGDAAKAPHPPWALTDAALVSVALLLRRYHEAVQGFDASPHAWATTVPEQFRETLVSHNDPNLDNVVFRDGTAVALIDFDLASPGSRVWDVALAARLWVPLRAPVDIPDRRRTRVGDRLRMFVDAYGLRGDDRDRVVEAATRSHDWCYDIIDAGARRGQPGYLDYWTVSSQQRARRGQRWLEANASLLREALR